MSDNQPSPVVPPPAAGAILPQWAVISLTVLSVLAGIAISIPSLPPVVHQVAAAIVALAAALGIASPGIRRPVPPVTLEQAAEVLRKGQQP